MTAAAIDPPYLTIARRYIGVAEVPGKDSNPIIANMWREYGDVWRLLGSDDSRAPWCGTFLAYCWRQAGLWVPKHPYRAKSWLTLPVWVPSPEYGCVVVFERQGGGHVGIVVGYDERGNLMVLGANQSDAVNIRPFAMSGPKARVVGYRSPLLTPIGRDMPLLASNGAPLSTNEA